MLVEKKCEAQRPMLCNRIAKRVFGLINMCDTCFAAMTRKYTKKGVKRVEFFPREDREKVR